MLATLVLLALVQSNEEMSIAKLLHEYGVTEQDTEAMREMFKLCNLDIGCIRSTFTSDNFENATGIQKLIKMSEALSYRLKDPVKWIESNTNGIITCQNILIMQSEFLQMTGTKECRVNQELTPAALFKRELKKDEGGKSPPEVTTIGIALNTATTRAVSQPRSGRIRKACCVSGCKTSCASSCAREALGCVLCFFLTSIVLGVISGLIYWFVYDVQLNNLRKSFTKQHKAADTEMQMNCQFELTCNKAILKPLFEAVSIIEDQDSTLDNPQYTAILNKLAEPYFNKNTGEIYGEPGYQLTAFQTYCTAERYGILDNDACQDKYDEVQRLAKLESNTEKRVGGMIAGSLSALFILFVCFIASTCS